MGGNFGISSTRWQHSHFIILSSLFFIHYSAHSRQSVITPTNGFVSLVARCALCDLQRQGHDGHEECTKHTTKFIIAQPEDTMVGDNTYQGQTGHNEHKGCTKDTTKLSTGLEILNIELSLFVPGNTRTSAFLIPCSLFIIQIIQGSR